MPLRSEITRRAALGFGAGAVASGLLGCAPMRFASGQHLAADLIVENARICTQSSEQPVARSLAVTDGIIMDVGVKNVSQAARGPATVVIDAAGRRLIPGLNDSHMHPTRGGRFYASELRWDGLRSLARGLEMISSAARIVPQGEWVRVVGGWSPYQFAERRMPSPAELTHAAPQTPVFVLFLYSRGFLNRAGVEKLGLTPNTTVPPLTRYEFTEDGGAILHAEPNPDLLYKTIGALPALSAEAQISSTKYFYRELNRFGLTSVIDAGGGGHVFPADYSSTQALGEQGDLSLRISNYLFPQNRGGELDEFRRWTADYDVHANLIEDLSHRYAIEGGGEFLTWSAGDFENFLWEAPNISTRDKWDRELLEVTRHLLRERWPIRIHATYDASMNAIMDVFETAHALERAEARQGFTDLRWAFDHAETATKATLQRVSRLGGGIAVQSRMAYAGEFFIDRFGAAAAARAPAMREMLAAGIPLGLGSDATRVASYNPWNTLNWAVTGRSIGGMQLLAKSQCLSRAQALFAHTVGSAWFSQEEAVKGRIAPGQFADFALLSDDFLTVSDEEIAQIESHLTVLGGEVVFGQQEFASLSPQLKPIEPAWSPVRLFGGYQSGR